MGDLRVFGPALLLGHFGLGRSLVLLELSAPRTVLILFAIAIAIAASWRNGGPLGSAHSGGFCLLFLDTSIRRYDKGPSNGYDATTRAKAAYEMRIEN